MNPLWLGFLGGALSMALLVLLGWLLREPPPLCPHQIPRRPRDWRSVRYGLGMGLLILGLLALLYYQR